MLNLFRSRTATAPTASARFRQSLSVTSVAHGDKTVLLDSRSEQFFSLDETGREIWEMIGVPRTNGEIVAALCQRFAAPVDQVTADVAEFLAEMHRVGLIEAVA